MLWGKKKIECPYCQKTLEKKPSRKTKCPFCKEYIFVRNQELVTKERAKILDALKRLEISDTFYDVVKKDMTKSLGCEPNFIDVLKSTLEHYLGIIKTLSLHEKKMKYYSMAIIMNENNQESFSYLQQSAKMNLLSLKEHGYTEEVELSGGSCPSCQKLKGKILTIDEALEQMPIPNKNCSHVLYDEKRGFCRCEYYPSSEIMREARKKYE